MCPIYLHRTCFHCSPVTQEMKIVRYYWDQISHNFPNHIPLIHLLHEKWQIENMTGDNTLPRKFEISRFPLAFQKRNASLLGYKLRISSIWILISSILADYFVYIYMFISIYNDKENLFWLTRMLICNGMIKLFLFFYKLSISQLMNRITWLIRNHFPLDLLGDSLMLVKSSDMQTIYISEVFMVYTDIADATYLTLKYVLNMESIRTKSCVLR